MKKILFIALVGIVFASVQNCPQGQLKIDGSCRTITYIPGCVLYTQSGRCGLCEYGYQMQQGKCQYAQKASTQCCVLTNSDGSCTQCAPGLVLDGSSCIRQSRPGCIEGRGSQCINCASDYQNIKGRCFKRSPSCRSYDDSGVCRQCQSGFQLIRGLCSTVLVAQVPQFCRVANQYGCAQCQTGYFLTKNRICKLNQIGCIKHYQQSCHLCEIGFQLVKGKCIMDGCDQYGLDGCSRCASPYVLSNKKCVLDNCLQSLNGRCTICKNEFRLKNGLCIKPISDRCQGCASGYFVGQNGRCTKNIVSCLNYTSEGKCSECADPFVLNGGFCTILGCDRLGQKGCEVCLGPFSLQNGRCIIRFCSEYNYQIRRCRSCQLGYHIQKGVCVKNDQYCSNYLRQNQEQICSKCQSDDYILSDTNLCLVRKPGCVYQYGKCISCAYPFKKAANSECYIQGCSRYSYEGCIQCKTPFVEKRGQCVIPNCEQMLNGLCSKCFSGFQLISNNCVQQDPRCVAYKDSKCLRCIQGYVLKQSRVCVKSIQFCKVLGFDVCEQCVNGYELVGGKCIIIDKYCQVFDTRGKGCAKCLNGYHTQQGICKSNDPTCAIYSQPSYSQRCFQCLSGLIFTTDGLGCIKQTPGCLYDKNGLCSSCRSPFIFSQKTCVLAGCSKYSDIGCYECAYPFVKQGDICVIQFCQKYNQDGPGCLTCQSGYKNIQGKCYREDPKCTQYNKLGQCISCIKQYTIFQNVCVRQDSNCLKYSKNGGCNKCKDFYYVSPDSICLPQEPGCVYQAGKCAYCNYPFKMHEKAQKCRIDGCLQAVATKCTKCKYPYQLNKIGECAISNCVTVIDNQCKRCTPGYHLKQGLTCARDEPSCLKYNQDGDCQLCDKGFMLMSSGQCQIAEDNCIEKKKNSTQCLGCKDEYFLNNFFQCQKKDKNCEQYNNGVCVQCKRRFFLYELICFPYSPGCVSYQGKDCIKCKSSYSLKNGQCFSLKKPSLKLEGEDDKYDFQITLVDITKSKYNIDNLSPISKLGKAFYSSFYSLQYSDPRLNSEQQNIFTKGWKAQNARDGQYIGYMIDEEEPVTFYAIQIEGVEGNYIKSFYLEYSTDGVNFIRIQNSFDVPSSQLTTIYFAGIYAKAIRIIVKGYYGWPAARIQFFYYDTLRFRKISNLKSLKYLKQSIHSNFVDRMQNQMFINQRAYFNPSKSCGNTDVCFTGFELCQAKTIKSLSISVTSGKLHKVYVTFSLDGRNFNCFEQCRQILIDQKQSSTLVILGNLQAKNIRVYPIEWQGSPNIKIIYDYS